LDAGEPVAGQDDRRLVGVDGTALRRKPTRFAAHLVFWPRPLAIVMSADSFAALTPEQQDALLTAGVNTVNASHHRMISRPRPFPIGSG
jgi:hypothetical protein